MAPDLPRSVPRFSVGDRIADTYLVKRIIEGGMGTVYVCHHERWNLDLVVKAPHAEILADPEHAHRITVEAEVWTDLGLHPHIAYCYYVHPLDGVPLLVIEYLDGGNLREWIADGRCADLKVGLELAIQFCHGLEHAHSRGLIHRDIKPENILLAADGTLKITDFGIVRSGDTEGGPAAPGRPARGGDGGTVGGMGTYEYMAPEQWVDAHAVDERADLFAFGVCLYEMFCGQRPYEIAAGSRQEPPEPQEVRGGNTLSEKLCTLLKRCVDWDRERRPESAAEVRKELGTLYEEAFQQPSAFATLPDVSLKADGFNNRGVTYLELGREAEAITCWQEALQDTPHHLEVTFNYGYWKWQKGAIPDDVYVTQMRELERSRGTDPDYWRCLAWVHLERGDIEAIEEIQQSEHRVEDAGFKQACGETEKPVGRLLCVFEGHTDFVMSICFSPDGRYALSGSNDRMLRLWEVASGHEVRCLAGYTNSVTSVCFSPDGHYAGTVRRSYGN